MNDNIPDAPAELKACIDPEPTIKPFEVTPVHLQDDKPIVERPQRQITKAVPDNAEDQDFQYVRENLKDLVETGNSALQSLFDLASQAENARAYEVLATTIKTLAEVNKDLLAMHEQQAKIKQTKAGKNPDKSAGTGGDTTNIQQNVVFTGTTADMAELLDKLGKNKIPKL